MEAKQRLDNRISQETAEGIDIYLTPAGLGARCMAYILDLLIRGAIIVAAAILLSLLGRFGNGLLLVCYFVVDWFYPVIFELTKGATPGKSVYNLRVVYDNGLPITVQGSVIRNLFRSVDFLPFGYLLGATTLMISDKKQRLGDIVAGTMVIHREEVVTYNDDTNLHTNPISLSLNAEEQATVVAFTERMHQFSEERQQEIANILSPVLQCDGKEAVEKLKSIGANLIGKS